MKFSETFKWIDTKIFGTGTYLSTIYLQTIFCCFSKIYHFWFFFFAIFFHQHGTIYMWVKCQTTSPLKVHISESYTSDSQKIMHIPRESRSLPKLFKNMVKFQIFAIFFFGFVNMGPYAYGSKSFKRYLLWKNTPNFPNILVYSWGQSVTKFVKRIFGKFCSFLGGGGGV